MEIPVEERGLIGAEGLMQGVEVLLNLLGIGTGLAGLFGGGGPNLDQMLEKLTFEIEQIFRRLLEDDAIKTAAAVAQSARDFLASDYANAVASGASDAELYAMLTEQADDRGTGALDNQAGIMEQWAADPNLRASNAQPTIALALAIHGLLITFYGEQALRAPDAALREAAKRSRLDYVNKAIERVKPLVDSIVATRLGSVGAITSLGEQGANAVWDEWYPERKWLLYASVGDSEWRPTPDGEIQISRAREAYVSLLANGREADREALIAAIGDAFGGGGDSSVPTGDQLKSDFVPEFQRWATWRVNAYKSLESLKRMRNQAATQERRSARVRLKRKAAAWGSR